jgi:hypothetical protein
MHTLLLLLLLLLLGAGICGTFSRNVIAKSWRVTAAPPRLDGARKWRTALRFIMQLNGGRGVLH